MTKESASLLQGPTFGLGKRVAQYCGKQFTAFCGLIKIGLASALQNIGTAIPRLCYGEYPLGAFKNLTNLNFEERLWRLIQHSLIVSELEAIYTRKLLFILQDANWVRRPSRLLRHSYFFGQIVKV